MWIERYSTLNRTFTALETCCVLAEDASLPSSTDVTLPGILPILTSKHVSIRTRGKVLNACVRSALLHGSDTWAPTAPDLKRLHRNDRSMIRKICGVRDDDEVPAYTLCAMLWVQELNAALRTRQAFEMVWTLCILLMRNEKSFSRVSDQGRHKLGCTVYHRRWLEA